MYKIEKKITNISPYNIFFKDDTVLVLDKKNKNISCITLNDFYIKWKIENQKYGFIILNNKIVCNNIIIYNVEGKLEYKHQGIEEFYNIEIFDIKNNFVLYKTVNEDEEKILYHIFDIDAKIFIKINIECPSPVLFISKSKLLCKTRNLLSVYEYNTEKFLWQKNIRDFFNKEDSKNNQLRIQEIYTYKDNFIVVSTFGILSLNPQDGSLIWKTESYARTMEIVDNFGYVCTSLSLYRVNLDNGEKYDYGRKYSRLPDFEYEGRTYWAAGHRVVYNDGLLWYLVYDAGDSFVIAIDPETANYQWIHKIDTYEKADEIEFHNDKMFILDTGGNLYIYEREI